MANAKSKRNYLNADWMELDPAHLPEPAKSHYEAMKAANAQAKECKVAFEAAMVGSLDDFAPTDNAVPVFGHNFGKLTFNFVDASEVKPTRKASPKAIKLA